MKHYFEYRGVSNGVYAPIIQDDENGIIYGAVKSLVGLSEVGKTTDASNEAHYYDNIPAIIVSGEGADTLTLNTSGIPFDVLSDITGQYYDSELGLFVEQERTPKYHALGYITEKTDGTKVLVWRLKGMFSIPDQTSSTKNNGTDANGQSLTYTGISTAYKFGKTSKNAKATNIDTSVNTTITEEEFFASVQTPDTVGGSSSVTGVGIIPSAVTVAAGDTYQLSAAVVPSTAANKAITWSTSDDSVATVSAAGLVTAVSVGSANITVTTADGGFTAVCAVTVEST